MSKQTRSACDRCYVLKERCQRLMPATTAAQPSRACTRCERLGLLCQTVRPIKRAGRPSTALPNGPRAARKVKNTRSYGNDNVRECQEASPTRTTSTDLPSFLKRLPPMSFDELQLIQTAFTGHVKHRNGTSATTSFSPVAILEPLLETADDASMAFLKDALLAYAVAISQSHDSENVTSSMAITKSHSVAYIAKAMASLRALSVNSPADAALCYALGSLIALSVYAAVGLGVSRVCRYCLGATSSFAVSLGHRDSNGNHNADAGIGDELRPLEGFMMLMEITDSLFYQRAPTPLRIMLGPGRPASHLESLVSSTPHTPAASIIDSHLGLCLPLLPYYHRLCTISNILAQPTTSIAQQSELYTQLEIIHKAIEPWQPSNLSQLLTSSPPSSSTSETVHLLTQAKLYRLGILLFAHRLRYPFDIDPVQDARADIWASEIIHEVLTTVAVTGRPMRFITLPLIIAGVEMWRLEGMERALKAVEEGVDGENVARALKEGVKRFLSKIWEEREARRALSLQSAEDGGGGVISSGMRWFDSVHKPCPIVESVYEELGVLEDA